MKNKNYETWSLYHFVCDYFCGSYIVTTNLNGTSAYVDETAQLVKDNQDDVVSRLEAKNKACIILAFQPVRVLSYCLS